MHSGELKGSFHDAIWPIFRVAQVFALMPVDGINAKDISSINFRWKSAKTLYSLAFLFCGTIECLLCLRVAIKGGLSLGLSNAFSFYVISMMGAFFIFKLATKWHNLMKLWYESEKVFLKYPYMIRGISLKRRIRFWAALVGFLSLRELLFPRIVNRKC